MSARRFGVWPSLPIGVHLRKDSGHRPYPLNLPDCRLFSLARQALLNGCRAMGLGPGDEVLMSAYHHGSEVEALFGAGLRVRFVDVTETLEPDPDELERHLRPTVRVLYLIHYLGFPQQPARWRKWCDERGLLLFEDAAQAWLATDDQIPVGSLADLAIYCMYKTVGVPDGAALISRSTPLHAAARRKGGWFGVAKRHGAWLSERSTVASTVLTPLSELARRMEDRTVDVVAREFELGDPQAPPSSATRRLLPRILDPAIPERRRENYRVLLDELGEIVPAPFASLPDGASPFAFPVETREGEDLVRQLEAQGVRAMQLWKYPHPSLEVPGFPVAKRLRDTVIALPVHQELRPMDVRRMIDVVRGVVR
jgi:dTDP-4-amino-4,6-dideoxygalactose transaminase